MQTTRERRQVMDTELGIVDVWGTRVGLCSWCDKPACWDYRDEDSQGDIVDYQVCKQCYRERGKGD
jgi:hypothetical protein